MSEDGAAATGGSARRSRRGFLKAVAVGGAALAAGPFLGRSESATAADPNPPKPWFLVERVCVPIPPAGSYCYNVYEVDIGQVTLGGILVSYVSAPLSARGSLTYSMSTTRTETMRVTTEYSGQVTSSRAIGPFSFVRTGGFRFSVSSGSDRIQGFSSRVTDAITHSSTETQSLQTAPVAAGGYNSWENTAFWIMARPVLAISTLYNGFFDPSNPDGERLVLAPAPTPRPLTYRFVSGGTIFPRAAFELRDDPGTRDFIGPETADAILAEYPLQPGQTSGAQLGLGGPRFALVSEISPGAVPFSFTRTMTGTSTHIEEQSRSLTTRIRSGFSFGFAGETNFDFQSGRSFTTVHTSVQETTNTQVMSTTGVLSSDLHHINRIYEDRSWNTLLVTDEGPSAFTAVSGTVTAADGSPIDGAVVTMPIDGIPHETFTGPDGRYALRLGGDIKPGEYAVICAGVTRTATVSRDKTAMVNYPRVSSGLARERPR
jgi:hypothetical protein